MAATASLPSVAAKNQPSLKCWFQRGNRLINSSGRTYGSAPGASGRSCGGRFCTVPEPGPALKGFARPIVGRQPREASSSQQSPRCISWRSKISTCRQPGRRLTSICEKAGTSPFSPALPSKA